MHRNAIKMEKSNSNQSVMATYFNKVGCSEFLSCPYISAKETVRQTPANCLAYLIDKSTSVHKN